MKVLSHRGYWKNKEEKNMRSAFDRSFSSGFGTETDVRDLKGELVICHDLPLGGEMSLNSFLELYISHGNHSLPLALNIKADGLQKELTVALNKFGIKNYFLFDMSIPDTLKSVDKGLICYVRESEYEMPLPRLYRLADGIWFDSFHGIPLDLSRVEGIIKSGKKVCLVSPELHGRPHLDYWGLIKDSTILNSDNLMICTDLPEDFVKFIADR